MGMPEQYRGGELGGLNTVVRAARPLVPGYDAIVGARHLQGYHDLRVFQTGAAVLQLLLDAQETLPWAQSYRNFRVAVAASVIGPYTIGRQVGFNIKLGADDPNDVHAEELMLAKAVAAGFTHIPAIALIGGVQADQTSGQLAETLLFCERRCMPLLLDSPLVDNRRTLGVMARPDFTVIKWGSMDAIRVLHETGDDSGLATARFDTTPAILQSGRWGEVRSEGAAAVREIDSTDYDRQVTLPLATRAAQLGSWAIPQVRA